MYQCYSNLTISLYVGLFSSVSSSLEPEVHCLLRCVTFLCKLYRQVYSLKTKVNTSSALNNVSPIPAKACKIFQVRNIFHCSYKGIVNDCYSVILKLKIWYLHKTLFFRWRLSLLLLSIQYVDKCFVLLSKLLTGLNIS